MPASERESIRVLHLGSPTGLYGAERWILALVKHLPARQVRSWVGVVQDVPGEEAPLCVRAADMGLPTKTFESPGRLSWSAVGELRRYVREQRIDILHTHGYKTDLIGRLATLGTGCLTVSTPHGWSVDAGAKLQLYEALDRLCFRTMDAVVPLSAELYQGLASRVGMRRKLHLILNGVDLSEIDVETEIPEPLRTWRAEGEFVIGYIGQLISRKRVDTLLRAFRRLEVPGKRLCVIGEGPQRGEFERLAADLGEADRVAFLGYREDRIALLRGFDVFVLPSSLEGIPRCLMEAMGAGIACIATDIPGCRDLVRDNLTGLVFAPGEDKALEVRLTSLATSPELRTRLANAGREHVRKTYSADAMAGRYLELYARLRARAGRS